MLVLRGLRRFLSDGDWDGIPPEILMENDGGLANSMGFDIMDVYKLMMNELNYQAFCDSVLHAPGGKWPPSCPDILWKKTPPHQQ